MTVVPIAQSVDSAVTSIVNDTPCVICGYNLRSLPLTGRCPECGSPVNRSVHGNLLRYADAEWLRMTLLGIRLMLWGILLMILVRVGGRIGQATGLPDAYFVGPGLAPTCLDLLSAFLITVQEPRISSTEDMVTWRRVIRICAVASFLGLGLTEFDTILKDDLFSTIALLLDLAAVPVYFGKFVYLRRFALRIPDPKLARSTRIVMWGFVITIGGAITLGILAGANGVLCLAGIGGLVFGLWYLVLLVEYRSAVRDALTYARQYAAATAKPVSPVNSSPRING